MRSISLSARRLILAGGFAVAAVAPALGVVASMPAVAPVHLANCPAGEDEDLYAGQCVPYLVPNSPASAATPANSGCPPGVSGAECGGSTGNEVGSPRPRMPAPVPPQEPEQELAEVVTPGY
ncbi:hypothetical protein A5765_06745 [Mycolicibacterium celeriflavum]|uniref:hypothetical protein n=1 Tax=Mycolicibacterium celeriflavum TaxID=1249101 RepID=UPI00080249BB|nr:hypothetical protein [Mycolicibacterium celeriflavum]OBG17014.1 hypothetical protein A5765_06745 [Mycolicibacterium celeriflavum]